MRNILVTSNHIGIKSWGMTIQLDDFIVKTIEAFKTVDSQIDSEGGEFDYRYSLCDNFIEGVLGWTRRAREGHYRVEKDRKDIICYDDDDPPFPVIVFETKKPSDNITLEHLEQLEGYLKEIGSAKLGVLTNGHKMILFEYVSVNKPIIKKAELDIDVLLTRDFQNLSDFEKNSILAFKLLIRDRFIKISDIEAFALKNKEIQINYVYGLKDIGYGLFVISLKSSLDRLTTTLESFFDCYIKMKSYNGDFLRSSFDKWEYWRAFTGVDKKAKQAFCRETAYIMLNRILFTRICEDKKIIASQKISGKGLVQFIRTHEGAKNVYLLSLNDAYRDIENHYKHFYQLNIFDWWIIPDDKMVLLSDEEKAKVYTLNDDLNYTIKIILSRMNRFDFEKVNRDILGHVYEDYLPKEERKELGEFYTPIEVVRYILDSTGYVPEKQIGDKLIIDPACGSGTFLTEIAERLIRYYLRKLKKIQTDQLTPDEAKSILKTINENVYGLDINPFAIQISEINLLFKTIDLYNIVIKKYREAEMLKFNIYCVDTLQIPEEIITPSKGQVTFDFFVKLNGRAKSFSEDIIAADKIKKDMRFDFVVGNPPYVRIQNLGMAKNLYENEYYETRYQNYDIYVLFIERGLKWLNDSGKLGYICPTRFTLTDYGQKLRGYISKKYIIEQIVDFKDTVVFDSATPYPCILILKSPSDQKIENNIIKCARVAKEKDDLLLEIKKHLNQPYICDEYDIFDYPQKDLADSEWYIMPNYERTVFENIKNAAKILMKGIRDDVFQGVTTSKDDLYFVKIDKENNDNLVDVTSQKSIKNNDGKHHLIERSLLKKILKGTDSSKWAIYWNDLYIIFPYKILNGKAELVPINEMENKYPKAWEYFNYYKNDFESRENGKLRGKDNWYGFIYNKNLEKFEQKKILTQVLSNKNSFVYDDLGEYYFVGGGNAGIYGITIDKDYVGDCDDYYYYTTLLNSKLLEFYEKHISVIFKGKFYSFGKKFIEKYPIAFIDDSIKADIISNAKEIHELYNQILELELKTSDINNYYKEDIKSNTKLLDLVIEQTLPDEIYKTHNMKIVKDSPENIKVSFKKGHNISFNSIEEAEFITKILQDKGNISKAELLSMNFPNSNDIKVIMSKYYNDLKVIDDSNAKIKELQLYLDDIIINKIYKITDSNDINVIDNFLKIW